MRFAFVGIMFVGIDYLSKSMAVRADSFVLNQGVSWGVADAMVTSYVVAAVLLLLIVWGRKSWKNLDVGEHWGLAFVVAGGVGNVLSRVWWGGVVDWIRVPLLPMFNLADLGIVLGALLMGMQIILRRYHETTDNI